MITFPQWLPALIAMGVSVFVVWVSLKIRAELAERDNIILKQFQAQAHDLTKIQQDFQKEFQAQSLALVKIQGDVLQAVRTELREYVSDQRFKDYVESHSREATVRDKEVTEFMTRHRDWKHDTEPQLRGIEMHIDELQQDVKELKEKKFK